MNVPAKLGVFALALGMVFAAAYAAGTRIGPVAASESAGHRTADDQPAAGHETTGDETTGDEMTGDEAASGPGGLGVSADGYRLRPVSGSPRPGQPNEYAFQIVDDRSVPVTRFQTSHDKQMHMIVVRRDLTGFQHLHPQMSPDGTWRTELALAGAGDWRVFADFVPEGRDTQVILGLDVAVTGDYRPHPLPEPAATAEVDGYTVTLGGHLAAGRTSRLSLRVARDGVPVTDLQPYLNSYGHLVALRAGDLGYLHVHPLPSTSAGPTVTFDVQVPTAGAYRLFLDFAHAGAVRTAQFTGVAD